ncbi:MAG: hypothetical protein AB7N76_05100 [Planctomycetota bacterium]
MDDEGPPAEPAPKTLTARQRKALCVVVGAVIALGAGCVLSPWLVSGYWNRRAARVLDGLATEGLGVDDASLFREPAADDGAGLLGSVVRQVHDLPEDLSLLRGSSPEALAAASRDPESELGRGVIWGDGSDRSAAGLEAAVKRLLARLDGHDAELDRALSRSCVFPVDRSQGYETEMPHLMGIKALLQVLEVRAGWASLEGRPAEAWADVERMLRLSARLEAPTLLERLVQIACLERSVQALAELLRLGPPPSAERRRSIDELLAELDGPGYQRAMRGELNMSTHSLPAEPGEFFRKNVPAQQGGAGLPAFLVGAFLYAYWRADLFEHQARLVRVTGGTRDEVLAEDARLTELGQAKRLGTLSALMLPKLSAGHRKDTECMARIRLARLALRLVRGGDLPAAAPPDPGEDPWDGHPLRYRRLAADRARIWSCGRDGVDDGGKAVGRDEQVPDSGTDLVVELAPPRRP